MFAVLGKTWRRIRLATAWPDERADMLRWEDFLAEHDARSENEQFFEAVIDRSRHRKKVEQ